MTPQEKKRLSYAKDRRNTYGENSKSSRKNIPLSKALSLRAERHAQATLLVEVLRLANSADADLIENQLRATPPRAWRKWPDQPLGEVLQRKVRSGVR
ncbi:hypothetical protein [Chitinimonas naiadis]